MLEECALPYVVRPIRLDRGEQFEPAFVSVSPNGRIPAIIDHDVEGLQKLSIFESGAILLYLAEKCDSFLPRHAANRSLAIQWLFWQVAGLGPMLGQHGHFKLYAKENVPYAIERYGTEARRLYRVLDQQLQRTGAYIAGEYSIADMACFPWIITHKAQGIDLRDYAHVRRWFADIRGRPQVQKGLNLMGGVKALGMPSKD